MIKINNLPKPAEIASAAPKPDERLQRKLKLKKATEAFESIFIAQMLKSMRSSTLNKSDKEESGFGKDIMLAMADEGVAKQFAKSGMLGVGQILYNHLLKRLDEIEPSAGLKITSPRHIDGVAPPRTSDSATPLKQIETSKNPPAVTESPIAMSKAKSSNSTERLERYLDHIEEAAKQNNLPEQLLRAVIMQESSGNPKAVSHKGAAGLMQLMPDTARAVGVTNRFDARDNIMGGARYLRQLLDRFGNLESALAAYNAGPGNVERYGGVPPFEETREYVSRVLSELSQAKQVNKTPNQSDIDL